MVACAVGDADWGAVGFGEVGGGLCEGGEMELHADECTVEGEGWDRVKSECRCDFVMDSTKIF